MRTATEARAALARGGAAAALEIALDAWRARWHPAIGDVVARLDTLARAGQAPPIEAKNNVDYHKAWLALAAASLDDAGAELVTGWLAATLTERVPDLYRYRHFHEQIQDPEVARTQALLTRGPDPRVARAIAELAGPSQRGFGSSLMGKLPGAFDAAAEWDPVAAGRIARFAESPSSVASWVRRLVEDRRDDYEGWARRPDAPPDLGAWQALLRDISPPPVDARASAAAFARVCEDPDADGPRAVLADLLLVSEDPQGEFLALALGGGDPARQASLLRAHGADWLGPLAGCLSKIEYERGFPARARVTEPMRLEGRVTDAAEDPRLGTLRELRVGSGMRGHYAQLLHSTAAKNLIAIDVATEEDLDRLVRERRARRFERVNLLVEPSDEVLERLAGAPAFERIHTLWVRGWPPPEALTRALVQAGWADRLEAVGVVGDDEQGRYRRAITQLGLRFELRTSTLEDYAPYLTAPPEV